MTSANGLFAENILFYGNSFTNGSGSTDSVPNLVRDIATSAGQATPTIFNAAFNGQSFTWHLVNNLEPISDGLPGGQFWDYAVMQNFSTAPTRLGDVALHRTDSVSLYQQIANHSPSVTPVLFETWARGPGHSFYTGSNPDFPGGPSEMQAEVRSGYLLAAQDIDAATSPGTTRIAEVGDRWEEANWDNLHAGDIYHAQNRGTLLAALEIYSTIYQDDTSDIGLTSVLDGLGLTEFDGQFLTSIVDGNGPIDPPDPPLDVTLKFDFGTDSHSDPRYNTVHWDAQGIPNAIDHTTGLVSGISLSVTSATGFNDGGPNTSGTSSPGSPASDFFDGDATDRNLFGHDTTFGSNGARPLVEYTIDGLDAESLYDFTFFASRLGASDNRETQFEVAGEETETVSLNPVNNSNAIAQVLSLQPTDTGEVVLTIQKGTSNTNSSGFFYLGALEIARSGSLSLPGDYNENGVVDAADYTVWLESLGGGSLPNEGVTPGVVDAEDYDFWKSNFGNTSSATSATASTEQSIPEPSSLVLLAIVLLISGLAQSRTLR